MPEGTIEWYDAVDTLTPHIVRISTPRGSGTGFLLAQAQHSDFCAIATAAHVIDHAHYWEQPTRIDHQASTTTVLLRAADRVIFIDESNDTAVLLLAKGRLPLPESPIGLVEQGNHLRVGNEIGWLGYPSVSPRNLCFFSGRVSHYDEDDVSYLVDGVAINGVSGGPAFYQAGPVPVIIGVVSAYIANRATGETLPGVAVVRAVEKFHEWLGALSSMDQAREEETQLEQAPAPPPDDAEGARSNTTLQPTPTAPRASRVR